MKLIPTFKATVKDSKIYFDNREYFDLYVGTLEGQRVSVVVKKFKKSRSIKSNRYYRAYLQIISEETGEDPDILHEMLKSELLPKRKINLFGIESSISQTTTNLSTIEFSEYLEKICILTGVPLPNPNDYYKA
jgi:hypothetical protein